MMISKNLMKKKVFLLFLTFFFLVVEVILKLGNEVLKNVGVEE